MQRTVVVAGGGISGLSACYHLVKDGAVSKVILLEGSSRLGGWMRSTRTEDGAVYEHGPRGMRTGGVVGNNTLCMISDLGLEGDLLPVPRDHPAAKNRYIYLNKTLHKLPGIGGLFRTVPPLSKPLLLYTLQDLRTPRGTTEDETIHEFFSRRFGKELADIFIDSLCRGVFAGDCRKLSIRSCFPFIFEAERKKGSVSLGMIAMAMSSDKNSLLDSPLIQRSRKERWSQWSLRQGMQTLSDALEDYLKEKGVEIHKDTPLKALERRADNRWQIQLPNGSVSADHVISAVPAPALSKLLTPIAEPMAKTLCEISAVTVAVVNLEYDGELLPASGFGHLIPSCEESATLGVAYDSYIFPEHNSRGDNSTRLTVMLGGAWFESSLGDPNIVSKETLLKMAMESLATQLGVKEKPRRTEVTLNKNCIPQYTLGHWKRIDHLFSYIRQHTLPLSLIGASYEGVSVNDCIYNAKKSVQRLLGS